MSLLFPFFFDPEYGRFPFDGNYEAVIHVRGHKKDAKFLEDYYIESSFGEMFYYDWDVEYKLRFVVDDAEFAAFDVYPYTELNSYAQTVGTPLKTGCEFVEWKTLPTLMPEGDLTVYAVFTKIRYCAVPTVGYANAQLRFDCETRTATKKCWFEKEECEVVEISAPCNPDTPKIGLAKYFDDKPLMSSRWKLVPCSETHYKGETKTWSVLVTYAHEDCYYKLGKDAEEYR